MSVLNVMKRNFPRNATSLSRFALNSSSLNAVPSRGLLINIPPGSNSSEVSRLFNKVDQIMHDDGTFKALARKDFHEKGWQKSQRKKGESRIRRANKQVGDLINFILAKKKQGH